MKISSTHPVDACSFCFIFREAGAPRPFPVPGRQLTSLRLFATLARRQ
jgi:hypothetical protein